MKYIEKFLKSKYANLAMAFSLGAAVMLGWVDAAVAGLVALAGVTAIESQGITIQYTVGSPTGSLTGIANVTGFSGPSGSASVIDTTSLSSTAKEKLMGLPDEGQFSLDLNLDPDATSHIALRTARAARSRVEFKVNFTDATPASMTFWGYVLGFQPSGAVDQQVKVSVTIEIDGPVTWG